MRTTIEIPDELLAPLTDVIKHYIHAKTKHPEFPSCMIHQAALICEESGESIQQANNGDLRMFRYEVGQTAAVSLRTLIHLQHK